jgi:hypothetical protein
MRRDSNSRDARRDSNACGYVKQHRDKLNPSWVLVHNIEK